MKKRVCTLSDIDSYGLRAIYRAGCIIKFNPINKAIKDIPENAKVYEYPVSATLINKSLDIEILSVIGGYPHELHYGTEEDKKAMINHTHENLKGLILTKIVEKFISNNTVVK